MRPPPLLVLAALLCGCRPAGPASLDPAPAPLVQLVDSVPWQNDLGEGYLRRVEVRLAGRVDTVPDLLTSEPPLLVSGPRLLGFAYEEDGIARAYDYDPRDRRLSWLPLPEDFNPYFSIPTLSPDGRHIAYVVAPGDATGWATVRAWPGGELVWRSEAVEVPATDAPGGNLTRWLSPDTAEVFIETGAVTESAWHRVLGSVRRRSVLTTGTVRQPPWR